jgi:hypothetical protein
MKSRLDHLPKILFFFSLAATIYAYGFVSHKFHLFPFYQIREVARDLGALRAEFEIDKLLYTKVSPDIPKAATYLPNQLTDGLILVAGIAEDRRNIIQVIDRGGNILHELSLDWFKIWEGDEGNFPGNRRPRTAPGGLLHGLDLLDNGDFVVNFEYLSTMRMNLCGEVVWKLDNLGHHSVHIAEDGTIWVGAETYYQNDPTGYRNHNAPLRSWTLQRISKDGEILETIPVIDVLRDNELYGLLSLSTLSKYVTEVSGDTLHLNDIETFPSSFTSSVFEAGDIMFSLRNINTIIVMDAETHKIKFRSTGEVLRQHDPDFIDGDVISIFDNHNLMPSGGLENQSSRIVEINAANQEKTVVVDGAMDPRFFTDVMGMHQRLPNGNILITSSSEGRVLETLPNGTLAWEYFNKVEEVKVGRLSVAMLLPPNMDRDFFESLQAQCSISALE